MTEFDFDSLISEEKPLHIAHMTQKDVVTMLYPDFDEHNDWVLWIKPELVCEKETLKVHGEIELETKNGNIVRHPFIVDKKMKGDYAFLISAFLGDNISNEYGIPFLFRSYTKLKELQEIHIKWMLIKEDEGANNPGKIKAKHLFMCYDLKIKGKYNKPDNRIFSLVCKHTEPEAPKLDEDIDKFETVLRAHTTLKPGPERCEVIRDHACASKIHATDKTISEEIEELFENYIDHIGHAHMGHYEEDVMGLVSVFTNKYIVPYKHFGSEIKYDVHFYETGITLRATNVNDINDDGYVKCGTEKYAYIKEEQTEMIRRFYPDYDENNDWVLWFASDLHYDHPTIVNEANVKLESRDTGLRKVNCELVDSACGARYKMVYPIVFKSFEEMSRTKFIDAEWLLIRNDTDEDADTRLFVEYIKIRHHLNLSKNKLDENARIFTIRSEDEVYTNNYVEILRGEVSTMYYNVFDNAYRAEADVRLDDNDVLNRGFALDSNKFFAIRCDYRLDKRMMLKNFANKYLFNMHTATARLDMMEKIKHITESYGYNGKFHYAATYQDRDAKLMASWLADVPTK